MQIKITGKKLRENFYCVSVGYCGLQNLLRFENSPYYNGGIYGWNYDTYTFIYRGCSVAICTGYRGMPNNCKGNKCTYDVCKEFDSKAALILADNSRNKKDQLDVLIKEFLKVIFSEVIK